MLARRLSYLGFCYPMCSVDMVYATTVRPKFKSCLPFAYFIVLFQHCSHSIVPLKILQNVLPTVLTRSVIPRYFPRSTLSPFLNKFTTTPSIHVSGKTTHKGERVSQTPNNSSPPTRVYADRNHRRHIPSQKGQTCIDPKFVELTADVLGILV